MSLFVFRSVFRTLVPCRSPLDWTDLDFTTIRTVNEGLKVSNFQLRTQASVHQSSFVVVVVALLLCCSSLVCLWLLFARGVLSVWLLRLCCSASLCGVRLCCRCVWFYFVSVVEPPPPPLPSWWHWHLTSSSGVWKTICTNLLLQLASARSSLSLSLRRNDALSYTHRSRLGEAART